LIDKLHRTEHLKIYREHIRKRLDKEYRREAQIKYIIFFFKGIVGSDLSKHIAHFI
jgi:nucleoid-associated protein YejK